MGFARKVWKLLVGIKDGLALIFFLLFFGALFAVLSARPNPGLVRDGALLLDLNGTVVEEVAPIDPVQALLSQSLPVREYAARDLVRAIDAAADDGRIKAIALDLSGFMGGGHVHMQELAGALSRFRAAEKPVYAYSLAYTDDALMLASQADEIWVDPMGGAMVTGPGGSYLFYGDALDRFGVDANVFRVGTYKSAVEPYLGNAMSDASRENLTQLIATLWGEWRANVAKARPQAKIDLVTQQPAAWLAASNGDLAKASLAAGLVDTIGTRTEWGARIAEVAGKDEWSDLPGAFATTEYDPFLAQTQDSGGLTDTAKHIAVVTIAGAITDGEAGPGEAGAARIERLLDDALSDDPAALVVRVDSPGGTTTGSETIRRAILRHKEKGIPIAVSMGNYAASGGYWVSTPAQRIFAEPETLTGSIGVFLVLPTFEELLANYGISSDGVRATPLSGQPDLLGGLTPETEALLQSSVEGNYTKFLQLVAASRKISLEKADELGQGRVWDGGAARQLGLVDQFGGLDDAIAWAATEAGLEDDGYEVDYLGSGQDMYGSILARLIATDQASVPRDIAAQIAFAQQARLGAVLNDFQRLFSGQGVQALCLLCTPAAAPRAQDAEQSFSLIAAIRKLAAN